MAQYNIFSILLLVSIFIWVIMRITISINTNSNKMETLFESIRSTILEDTLSVDFSTSRTSNFVKLSNLALSKPSLKSIVVTDNENKIFYLFARNPNAVVKKLNGTQVIQELDSLKDKMLSGFEMFNGKTYQIKTVFTVMENSLIVQTFKITVIILTAYLLISLIILFTSKSDLNVDTINRKSAGTKSNYNHEMQNPKDNFPFVKLTNELKRAASFDQDLVLTLIKVPGEFFKKNHEEFQNLLNNSFAYSDLIFNYTDYSFAVILPNADIDQGIATIKEFDQNVAVKIDMLDRFTIHYGLSSRNGRLIEGRVLYNEASAALRRSLKEQESNIIGFRPDPAKYREFLSKDKS